MPTASEGPKRSNSSQTGDSQRSGRVDVRTVPKPWGHETIWASTDQYVGKILHIKAGHALSVQYHNAKDETVHLLSGEIIYRVQRSADGRIWLATAQGVAVFDPAHLSVPVEPPPTVIERIQIHDHTLFVAEVTSCGNEDGTPLISTSTVWRRTASG